MGDEQQLVSQQQPASEDPAVQAAEQAETQDPQQPAGPGDGGGAAQPDSVWHD